MDPTRANWSLVIDPMSPAGADWRREERAADLDVPDLDLPLVRFVEVARLEAARRVLDVLAVERGDLRFAVEVPPRRAAFFDEPARDPPVFRLAEDFFFPLEDRLEAFFAIPTSFPLK